MTDEVSTMIETYADMVHGKLRQVGFFDDEGQFDVTEELCLAVNNLQVTSNLILNKIFWCLLVFLFAGIFWKPVSYIKTKNEP